MSDVTSNTQAGQDTSSSGRRGRRTQTYKVGECVDCHEPKPLVAKGLCRKCYSRQRAKSLVGTCTACGKSGIQLQARGLCQPCLHAGASGEDRRRRRVDTPEEVAAAVHRQDEFCEVLIPLLRRYANWAFRNVINREDRLDLVAECLAVGWRDFVREIAHGRDPVTFPRLFARHCASHVRHWNTLCGRLSTVDVLSKRVLFDRVVTVCHDPHKGSFDDVTITDEQLDLARWLTLLTQKERDIVEYCRLGNTWDEAVDHFCLTRKEREDILDSLWNSWQASR